MYNLENAKVNGIPYSRFIASWVKACTQRKELTDFDEGFKDWLRHIEVPEEDVKNIYDMADCGKLELEMSAELYLTSLGLKFL